MKQFRVKLTQTILVEIEDERATEKSAAYLAESTGACFIKEGRSRNLGAFKLTGEQDAKASEIREVDSSKKSR